jgi:ubiquitin-large subunit ribosomal protein L40e
VDGKTVAECNIQKDSNVYLFLKLLGGGLDATLKALAQSYVVSKKICRDCYARLPPKAHNCRKRSCGHSANLRIKKPLKD